MSFADKMARESRLLTNLVNWMESHGEVLSERTRSNHYVGVRIRTIRWHERVYTAVEIDEPDDFLLIEKLMEKHQND